DGPVAWRGLSYAEAKARPERRSPDDRRGDAGLQYVARPPGSGRGSARWWRPNPPRSDATTDREGLRERRRYADSVAFEIPPTTPPLTAAAERRNHEGG